MNKKIIWMMGLCLIALVVSFMQVIALRSKLHAMKADKERLSIELAHAMVANPLVSDTIRDTVRVATSPVVTVERRTFKNNLADKALLNDLDLRAQQVESWQKTGTAVADTVRMKQTTDSLSFTYVDRWANFYLSMKPPDTTLAYSVRDSVTTIVYREYKHRFLWWRWGTKGYKVKIINFNPHARVLYNQYVRIRE